MSSVRFVPGIGNRNLPEIMFIGEAPGEQEDLQGEPFVGRSGKLLDKWIAHLGFERSEVYISNVVKVRPENNRTPTWAEVQSWMPLLKSEIIDVMPRVIVTLGLTAARALQNNPELLMKEAKTDWFTWEKCYSIKHIYHPSYILRTPGAEKFVLDELDDVIGYLNEYKDD